MYIVYRGSIYRGTFEPYYTCPILYKRITYCKCFFYKIMGPEEIIELQSIKLNRLDRLLIVVYVEATLRLFYA